MAVITEKEAEIQSQDTQEEPTSPSKNPKTKPKRPQKPQSLPTNTQNRNNPFVFWFYFTISVSLVTLLAITFSSITSSNDDPKSFFLSLSTPLRHHYSKGRTVKVQLANDQKDVEVFVLESDKRKGLVSENVVIVHGLGLSAFSFRKVVDFLGSKGIHGAVFDLPGNGFSDKSIEVLENRGDGVLERFKDVYGLIKEKGVFWAFESMVETGELPYEQVQAHYSGRKSVARPIALGSEEVGKVLGQVIETLGLAPVHLVLHDSSLGMAANWVLQNADLVRSVTLVDTGSRPALPLWVLDVPVVREVVLGFNFAYGKLISLCCSRGIGALDLEAHRVVLKGRDGRKAVVGTGMKLNSSFDVAEWGGMDGIKGTPVQLIWSKDWSKEWTEEGKRVAEALPHAKFVTHSGGRWPQEDVAEELAESIVSFVSSLPKSVRRMEEEVILEHIQKLLDEAKLDEAKLDESHHHDDHHHNYHHDHNGYAHMHGAGFMDTYGFGAGMG